MPDSRNDAQSEYWFQEFAPNLIGSFVMPPMVGAQPLGASAGPMRTVWMLVNSQIPWRPSSRP
jgi:hypothetical protein